MLAFVITGNKLTKKIHTLSHSATPFENANCDVEKKKKKLDAGTGVISEMTVAHKPC